jgi:hypothetical protein
VSTPISVGAAGTIRGDVIIRAVYDDKQSHWLLKITIGCYDKSLKSGFWLMGLGIVKNGKLIDNIMRASIAGKNRGKLLVNISIIKIRLNKTRHFVYT